MKLRRVMLTVPEKGQYGIDLPSGEFAGWMFSDFVWQAGGEIVRQRPDGGWKLTLDEPAAPMIDMLLAKNRAGDRKTWLMEEGNKAEILD